MIVCERCGAEVPEGKVRSDLGLAECASCGLVFLFSVQPDELVAERQPRNGLSGRDVARKLVAMPEHYFVDLEGPASIGSELSGPYRGEARAGKRGRATSRVRIRWARERSGQENQAFGFLSGCGIVAVALWTANEAMHPRRTNDHLAIRVTLGCFAVLFAALGIFLAYSTLANMVNTTTVSLVDGLLRVTHGPLPWPGDKRIYASDIEQIFCEAYRFEVRRGRGPARPETAYLLRMKLRGADTEVLLQDFEHAQEALYIEQVLESAMGIIDARVEGELPRA